MTLHPIFSSLIRHKLTVLLLVLQVTCTFAIVCNVAFMIAGRTAQMRQPSGVAEDSLMLIDSTGIDTDEPPLARHDEDLAALRHIAGVDAVAAVDALPFNQNNWSNGIATAVDDKHGIHNVSASAFNGTPGELATLGLHLVEGRDFLPAEYLPMDVAHGWLGIDKVSVTIVTRALAERLFPGQHALGRDIYASGTHPTRIIGIVDHLLRPALRDTAGNEYAMLFPMVPDGNTVTYALHASSPQHERMLKEAAAVLNRLDGNRILANARSFAQLRNDYFRRDHTMIGLLLAAGLGLLLVTTVGIAGLASFWVQQRRRSIGVRRALGATRQDILRYFQGENFLIVGIGIVLGMALAYALNLLLMRHYELARLPFYYLPIGALALWLLGQLAVLGPALRAAAVSPVAATRTG